MDPLELAYDSIASVPEQYRGLYEEQDGKAVLTKVNGLKTQADIDRVQEALRKERNDHASVKEALKPWKSLGDDPTKIQAQLDRISELELAAQGKMDDAAIQKLVDSRLTQKTAPLERSIKTLSEERDAALGQVDVLKKQIERRDMDDYIGMICTEMKVVQTAIPDIKMIAATYLERDASGAYIVKADAQGVTPGADAKTFMKEMQKIRPHWWPPSTGGGAGGGGGLTGDDNPWSKKGWNMTAQAKVVREKGMAVAEEMAKAVGSSVGATKPADQSK